MGKHPLYNQTGLQRDNKSHVLYALASKQMELKQIQDEYEIKISKIKLDLVALETTICLFDCDCNETIKKISEKSKSSKKRERNLLFERGELKKLILMTLRTSNNPLKTDEITNNTLKIKEFDNQYFVNVQKSVLNQLVVIEKNQIAYKSSKEGLNYLWKIKD